MGETVIAAAPRTVTDTSGPTVAAGTTHHRTGTPARGRHRRSGDSNPHTGNSRDRDAAGGWWVFQRGPDGAEGAITAYLDALDDGDFDALTNLIHQDGPVAGTLEMTEAEFEERVSPISVDIDAVEQYDEETDVERSSVQRFAAVFAAYTLRRDPDETGNDSGGEQPESEQIAETLTVALHPDGGWKLWERTLI